MKYFAITFGAVILSVSLLAIPTTRTSAAPRPTPTPTPVAIGYDEINRTAMMGTPPPPGQFIPDYNNIMAAAPAVDTSAAATPEPRHRGGLGSMLGAAMGNLGGNPNMGAMQNPMAAMQNGTLIRYTYYWLKQWVRTDDPVKQTATIEKCNLHQFIYLDLAKKTYRIETTTPKACAAPASPYGGRSRPGVSMAPGTVDLTVKSTASAIGPKTLEGIPTQGYDSTMSMSMSNATGSCTNSSFGSSELKYVSRIGKQRDYCPLSVPHYTGAAGGGGATGGCKPTMHLIASGSIHPPDDLEMYIRTTMNMPQMQGHAFSTVLERGHVDWYLKPQADALFEVPPGFTQEAAQ